MKKNITIPNWSTLVIHYGVIDIVKHTENGRARYSVILTYIFEDGNQDTENEMGISMVTDIITDNVDEAVHRGFATFNNSLQEFSAIVRVYDSSDDHVIDEINLNEYFDDDNEEDEVVVEEVEVEEVDVPKNRTLH